MSTLVSAEQVSHSFNDEWLFKNLTFGINEGQRVALVGVNGAGKSTLLKILAEQIKPAAGKVVKAKDIKFGYLDQDPKFADNQTISDYIFSIDNRQQQVIKEYEAVLEFENPDVDLISRLTDEISNLEAWEYEHQIKTILGRLEIHQLHQKIETLSGGQRKRLSLAKLLIDEPEVYIIDEPTNHLDIDTIEWLESFLSSGNKTILMVTHDRYFLDNVCNEIIELQNGLVYSYKGNYAYYLEKKSEREEVDATVLAKRKNLLKKELEWMRRMPQARGTKSKSRIDAFYDLEEKTKSHGEKINIKLDVKISRQGKQILELVQISKSYHDKMLIDNFSYVFKKGDKIGLTGKNGSGKSTLLNLITQQTNPDLGKVITGETTVVGYYTQTGLNFKGDERVIDVVKNIAEYITMSDGKMITASQLLTHFLFPPKKQHGFVSKLSGGEKKRLHLMKVLIKNPNFLILDEPTNDLDIDTLNVLEEFLQTFNGILILVSHDRYLVDKLTDQLFIMEGGGNVRIFNGNYSDYRLQLEEYKSTEKKVQKPIAKIATAEKKLSYTQKREIEDLENLISSKEIEIKELTEAIQITENVEELLKLTEAIGKLQTEIDALSEKWILLTD